MTATKSCTVFKTQAQGQWPLAEAWCLSICSWREMTFFLQQDPSLTPGAYTLHSSVNPCLLALCKALWVRILVSDELRVLAQSTITNLHLLISHCSGSQSSPIQRSAVYPLPSTVLTGDIFSPLPLFLCLRPNLSMIRITVMLD